MSWIGNMGSTNSVGFRMKTLRQRQHQDGHAVGKGALDMRLQRTRQPDRPARLDAERESAHRRHRPHRDPAQKRHQPVQPRPFGEARLDGGLLRSRPARHDHGRAGLQPSRADQERVQRVRKPSQYDTPLETVKSSTIPTMHTHLRPQTPPL